MGRYMAVIDVTRRCPACEELEAGIFNRIDCGCAVEEVVGRYDTLLAACGAARGASTRKGRRKGWKAAGPWRVLDAQADEAVMASGQTAKGGWRVPDRLDYARSVMALLEQAREGVALRERGVKRHGGQAVGDFIQESYRAALADCRAALALSGVPEGDRDWLQAKASICEEALAALGGPVEGAAKAAVTP